MAAAASAAKAKAADAAARRLRADEEDQRAAESGRWSYRVPKRISIARSGSEPGLWTSIPTTIWRAETSRP